MSPKQPQIKPDHDPAGLRERRVSALRSLVEQRAYDVPAEDVAASVIRDAIVVSSPEPTRPH